MKNKTWFWALSALLYLAWLSVSHFVSVPGDWWSMYTSNASTTDPFYPMPSWSQLLFFALVALGVSYLVLAVIRLFKENQAEKPS